MKTVSTAMAGWIVAALLLAFYGVRSLHQQKIDETSFSLVDAPKTRVEPIYVAAFDSGDDQAFNKYNCETARELFQKSADEGTAKDDVYQCESGRFKK